MILSQARDSEEHTARTSGEFLRRAVAHKAVSTFNLRHGVGASVRLTRSRKRVVVRKVATRRLEFGTPNATRIGPRTQERQPPFMLGTAYREERFPFLGPANSASRLGVEVFDNLLNIVHARHLSHRCQQHLTEPVQDHRR